MNVWEQGMGLYTVAVPGAQALLNGFSGTGGSLKRFRLKEFRFRTCKFFVIMYLQHIEMNIEVDVNDFK